MRRLSMKNKRRKSETASDSESEKNGGARIATDNDENDDALITRMSASKRRSSRSAPAQKPATGNAEADDADVKDDSTATEKEQTNGEKTAGQKPTSKRRKKEDQKASTSADISPDNEYEVSTLFSSRQYTCLTLPIADYVWLNIRTKYQLQNNIEQFDLFIM